MFDLIYTMAGVGVFVLILAAIATLKGE